MTTSQTVSTDVLIVGAGPTGLYGAYYAGFRGLTTTVVDVLPQSGGQVMALYPEKQIRDVAAIPTVKGRDFVAALVEQASAFDPTYLLGRQALTLEHTEDAAVVTLDDGTVVRARAVVLTSGIGTPTPARSVTLVHRRKAFRGHAATLERVRSGSTRLHTDTQVVALSGDGDRLTKVTLRTTSGEEAVVQADHVIAALGFISDLGPLRDWGLELRGRSVAVDRAMRTNLPRVYAAGDLADYDGKVKLMSVGFGEVATAMNHVAVDLDPELTLFPGHSTDAA